MSKDRKKLLDAIEAGRLSAAVPGCTPGHLAWADDIFLGLVQKASARGNTRLITTDPLVRAEMDKAGFVDIAGLHHALAATASAYGVRLTRTDKVEPPCVHYTFYFGEMV